MKTMYQNGARFRKQRVGHIHRRRSAVNIAAVTALRTLRAPTISVITSTVAHHVHKQFVQSGGKAEPQHQSAGKQPERGDGRGRDEPAMNAPGSLVIEGRDPQVAGSGREEELRNHG